MKKIFLFLIALVGIVACSKSDSGSSDNGGGGSVAGYNPPDWIIGTWINDIGGNTGYSFTKKDYCITAGPTLCYLSGSMKQAVTKVEQEIKGDIYTLLKTAPLRAVFLLLLPLIFLDFPLQMLYLCTPNK